MRKSRKRASKRKATATAEALRLNVPDRFKE